MIPEKRDGKLILRLTDQEFMALEDVLEAVDRVSDRQLLYQNKRNYILVRMYPIAVLDEATPPPHKATPQ